MAIPRSVKPGVGIKGMDIVMSNLRKEIVKIKGRSMKGLIESAIIIRRDMEKTPPKIPVDTGNLRGSWFTTSFYVLGSPALTIGFSANYAVFVHEMVDADFTSPRWRYKKGKKRYWHTPRAGAGAKFFEASLKRNKALILKTIQKNAYIK